jgi:solute:Na+ symporter, SSS family
MHPVDWLILIVAAIIVAVIAFRTRRYVRGVSDFLVGGRVANRYVVCVASGEAAFGLISAIGLFEYYYNSGFALSFWGRLVVPISMFIILTGFATYRYRETRVMTLGQFLEIRYSKRLRIFAGVLQSISGILNYGIFPAVGARFFMYFCGLPTHFMFIGMQWSTLVVLMAMFLGLAALITTLGGQITVMATDCIQGILSYPMFLVIAIAVFLLFSWKGQMAPALMDRPPGQSMLNPFDVGRLRYFNLFYIFVGIMGSFYNILSFSGLQGYNASAISAHEQKMGAILGRWRGAFSSMVFILLAVAAYTYMNHTDFADRAAVTYKKLIEKTMNDVNVGEEFATVKGEIKQYHSTGRMPEGLHNRIEQIRVEEAQDAEKQGKSTEQIEKIRNPQDPTPIDIARTALKSVDKDKAAEFSTISKQMRVPLALRDILPIGITGMFCAIMLFFMVSTNTTYMHSWGSILVQDIILPFRKTAFTPKQQLFWLRMTIFAVAVFAFFFSLKFGQVTYILMFMEFTGAIWAGGAGVVVIGGLYWKRGTTAGAWTGLFLGSSLALSGLYGSKHWAGLIYPWIAKSPKMLEWTTRVIEGISAPFRPIIDWRVTPDAFPINGKEMLFLTMLFGILSYVAVSLLTCRNRFNLDRMLHRGQYRRKDDPPPAKPPRSAKELMLALVGITSEFKRNDKILSWSVFIYMMGWGFGAWLIILIWNLIKEGRWPNEWWAMWFSIKNLIVPAGIGLVSTFWFTIGGTVGLKDMFKRLAEHEADVLDDGRVVGHVSADDIDLVEKIEHMRITDAHEDEGTAAESDPDKSKD